MAMRPFYSILLPLTSVPKEYIFRAGLLFPLNESLDDLVIE
jgi:hypothetical protein